MLFSNFHNRLNSSMSGRLPRSMASVRSVVFILALCLHADCSAECNVDDKMCSAAPLTTQEFWIQYRRANGDKDFDALIDHVKSGRVDVTGVVDVTSRGASREEPLLSLVIEKCNRRYREGGDPTVSDDVDRMAELVSAMLQGGANPNTSVSGLEIAVRGLNLPLVSALVSGGAHLLVSGGAHLLGENSLLHIMVLHCYNSIRKMLNKFLLMINNYVKDGVIESYAAAKAGKQVDPGTFYDRAIELSPALRQAVAELDGTKTRVPYELIQSATDDYLTAMLAALNSGPSNIVADGGVFEDAKDDSGTWWHDVARIGLTKLPQAVADVALSGDVCEPYSRTYVLYCAMELWYPAVELAMSRIMECTVSAVWTARILHEQQLCCQVAQRQRS